MLMQWLLWWSAGTAATVTPPTLAPLRVQDNSRPRLTVVDNSRPLLTVTDNSRTA